MTNRAAQLPKARTAPLLLCALASLSIAILWIIAINPGNGSMDDVWIWPVGGLLAGFTVASLILSWLFTPRIHRHGNFLISFLRSWKINSLLFPWLTGAIIANTAVYIFGLAALDALASRTSPGSPARGIEVQFIVIATTIPCAFLYIRHISRAARRFAETIPPPLLPVICEICGYELIAGDQTTRCPECGQSPPPPRQLSAWEMNPSFVNWWRCVARVLIRPGAFYRRLSFGGSIESSARFATSSFRLMIPAASFWIICMSIYGTRVRPVFETIIIAIIPSLAGALAVALVGWLLTRAVAALVFTAWSLRGSIRDGRGVSIAFDYESSFIWAFCLFNGLYFTSLMLTSQNTWIGQVQLALLGHRRPIFGIGIEPLVLLTGNAVLIICWFVRYQTTLSAIRWSNS